MHASLIPWALLLAGGALVWSLAGVDRRDRAAVRRRLLPGAGLLAAGLVALALLNRPGLSGSGERAAADAFTVAWLSRGRAAAARYLAPEARVLALRLPPRPVESAAAARRLTASAAVDSCGAISLFQPATMRCVTYADGRRVVLVRAGGAWRVVGFTQP